MSRGRAEKDAHAIPSRVVVECLLKFLQLTQIERPQPDSTQSHSGKEEEVVKRPSGLARCRCDNEEGEHGRD